LQAVRSRNRRTTAKYGATAAPADDSPIKIELTRVKGQPSLLEQEGWRVMEDMSFDEKDFKAASKLKMNGILGRKGNVPAQGQ